MTLWVLFETSWCKWAPLKHQWVEVWSYSFLISVPDGMVSITP